MLTTAMVQPFWSARGRRPRSSVVAGTGWCTALASGRATHPAVARRDRGGDCPAESGKRTREVDPSERAAPAQHTRAPRRRRFSPAARPSTDRAARPLRRRSRRAGSTRMRARRPRCSLARCVLAAVVRRRAAGGRGAGRARSRALWAAPLAGDLGGDPPVRPAAGPVRRRAPRRGPGRRARGRRCSPPATGVVVFAGHGRRPAGGQHRPRRTACGRRTSRCEPVGRGRARRWPAGSPIGALAAGHAGCPRAACLHWGLRRGEAYLDPLALLRPPRVRLLPWD